MNQKTNNKTHKEILRESIQNASAEYGGQILDNDTQYPYEDELGTAEIVEAAEYQGRKVSLNKPFRTPGGPKKFSVYVKNNKGNIIKVSFGDPNMEIKKDNPERRRAFKARHNCSEKKDKTKPGWWSCNWSW